MEVEVASAADTTVVVVTPRWGDAMQANKAGLLEVADIFVINKADRPGVAETRRDLAEMLNLSAVGDWRPPILATVAGRGEGVDELWAAVAEHRRHLRATGGLEARRAARLAGELRRVLAALLAREVEDLSSGADFAAAAQALVENQSDPYQAAEDLLAAREHPAPG
jgi:LAO/AO transport system kinase